MDELWLSSGFPDAYEWFTSLNRRPLLAKDKKYSRDLWPSKLALVASWIAAICVSNACLTPVQSGYYHKRLTVACSSPPILTVSSCHLKCPYRLIT